MKESFPLKICPWCHHTGKFMFKYDNPTWLVYIYCANDTCKVKPKAHYVPIRKEQRENVSCIREKIKKCIQFWNDGDLNFKNEGFQLNIQKIVDLHKEGKLTPEYARECL